MVNRHPIYGTAPKAPSSFKAYRAAQSSQIPAADRKALPILTDPAKEQALVKHVMERVTMADDERRRRATRCQLIDTQLSGFVALGKEDKKRDADNKVGKPPKPTDHNLPMAGAQLDECVTYLMSVFAPEMDFFEAVAPADKQSMAQAVVAEMNRHSQKGQYYRYFAKALVNMLRYNIGGWTCYWEQQNGILFDSAPGGIVERKDGVVWQGNRINSFDCYNTFYDTSVHPVDLPSEGEFFAEVERKTPFRVRKMAQDGQLYGVDRFADEVFPLGGPNTSPDGNVFFLNPPSVRDESAITKGGGVNWAATLNPNGLVRESAPGVELMRYTGWIRPYDFGLSNSKAYELYRIVIGNSKCIANAIKLEDSHGMLPIAIGCPLEDDLRNEQRTYAEQLIPLQHFQSFLMNTHQAAVRKAIYGITIYLASLFPGLDLEHEDLIGAVLPMRSSAGDIDIDKAFRHYNAAPETDANVDMIQKVDAIMQKILPTDMVRQVADLERATLYQAAATVQAGNRRQLKVARIISDQALNPLKFQMTYNLYANLPDISYIAQSGQRTSISVGDLVQNGIEFEIGTGLKGLDRLMTIQILRDVLTSLIQSQQGIAEIDIVGLLNYFMTLAGDRTDLRQFRRVPPQIDPKTGQPIPGTGQPAQSEQPAATGNVPIVPGSEAQK